MPKITFTVDHKVQQHDGNGPEYKAGQSYDLHGSYAEKYKRLGYAVDYVAPAPVAEKPKAAPEPSGDVMTPATVKRGKEWIDRADDKSAAAAPAAPVDHSNRGGFKRR